MATVTGLITRTSKGTALTHAEMDGNFNALKAAIESVNEFTTEAADDRVATLLAAGAGITVTYNDAGNILTIASSIDVSTKQDVAINVVNKTASYTLILADNKNYLRFNSATAVNLTVPANSAVAFPIGSVIPVTQVGVGQITVVPDGGVTINKNSTLISRAQFTGFTLTKVATDEWDLIGDMVA